MKFLLILFTGSLFMFGFTKPSNSENNNLFYIGRSRDLNIIKYDVNLTDEGKINLKLPIVYYWVKNTKGGKIERLTFVQDKLAYGIKYISVKANEVKFQFVSYPNRTFVLKRTSDGKFRTITYVNNSSVELNRIYVQIDGGTFMVPKISYVNMFWKGINNNNEGIETIIP